MKKVAANIIGVSETGPVPDFIAATISVLTSREKKVASDIKEVPETGPTPGIVEANFCRT